ncbi:MAG: hypothetical protein FWD25_03900 [Clostridia bacterium]|nr:hypothetical protein [Clostridia bacterium]
MTKPPGRAMPTPVTDEQEHALGGPSKAPSFAHSFAAWAVVVCVVFLVAMWVLEFFVVPQKHDGILDSFVPELLKVVATTSLGFVLATNITTINWRR